MKYIKKFKTTAEYESYINDPENFIKPNVSLCKDTNFVYYHKYVPEPDYSKEYFTIEALEDGTVGISLSLFEISPTSFKYRLNNGVWIETLEDVELSVSANDKIQISCVCDKFRSIYQNTVFYKTNIYVNVYGNVMSLLYGDDFVGQTDLTGRDYAFFYLLCNIKVVSAENLILPATTLAYWCYGNMFQGCTLKTAPLILPATTLANSCYCQMFEYCKSLTTAPELPSTELVTGCYINMFYGCTSLTTAPELPATTLVFRCYNGMFYGCTKLNYIKMLATDISALFCLMDWVSGVATTGTFVKAQGIEIPTASTDNDYSGIPEGWTVEDYNNNDPANGYEYVDLGLPSGTKWATCNVGASKPEESGLCFAWGNTVGYTADDVRNGNHVFDGEHDVLDGDNDPYNECIKYNSTDGLTTLLPEDDAASANMGGDWHMPTKEQLEELTANTTSTWTTMNGVNGTLFTSNINGNTLFIPAAGSCIIGSVYGEGSSTSVWSSSLYVEYPSGAWSIIFSSSGMSMNHNTRYDGRYVRGVLS